MTVKVHLCSVEDESEENNKNMQLTLEKLKTENIHFTTGNDVKASELEWKGVAELISKVKWVILFYTAQFMNFPQGEMLEAISIENALAKGLRNVIVLVPLHLVGLRKESVSVFPYVLMTQDEDSWLDELVTLVNSPRQGLTTFDICYNPQHVNMEFTTGFVHRKYHSEPEPLSTDNEQSLKEAIESTRNCRKRILKTRRQQSAKRKHRFYGKSSDRKEIMLKPTFNVVPMWLKLIPNWAVYSYAKTMFQLDKTTFQANLHTRLFLDLSVYHEEIRCTPHPNNVNVDGEDELMKITTILPKTSEERIPFKGYLTDHGDLVPGSIFLSSEEQNFEETLMLAIVEDKGSHEKVSKDYLVPGGGETIFHFSQATRIEGTVCAEIYDENDTMCYFIKDVNVNKIIADLKRWGLETGPVDIDSDQQRILLNWNVSLNVNHGDTSDRGSGVESDEGFTID